LVDVLHRLTHHSGSGVQQLLLARQTPPSPQFVAAHVIIWPQLFVTVPPHLPAHGVTLSGVQQVSLARQTSVFDWHAVVPALPQGTL
jgi:hypothetical protein